MSLISIIVGAALIVIVLWAINTYVTSRLKTPLLVIVGVIAIIFLIYVLFPGARIS